MLVLPNIPFKNILSPAMQWIMYIKFIIAHYAQYESEFPFTRHCLNRVPFLSYAYLNVRHGATLCLGIRIDFATSLHSQRSH